MVPQAATYVARFGDAASAALLDPLPDESAYDLARALLQARAGQAETARVALENLTASSSAQTAAYARAALVGLMLEKDMLAPATAAEAYGKLLENEGQPATLPSGPKATIRLGQAHAFALAGQPQAALAVLDRVLAGPDVPEDVLSSGYLAILRGLVFPETVRGAPAGGAALAAPFSAAERIGLIAAHLPHVRMDPPKRSCWLAMAVYCWQAGGWMRQWRLSGRRLCCRITRWQRRTRRICWRRPHCRPTGWTWCKGRWTAPDIRASLMIWRRSVPMMLPVWLWLWTTRTRR
nr:hypothetical protein [Acetobacter persici]